MKATMKAFATGLMRPSVVDLLHFEFLDPFRAFPVLPSDVSGIWHAETNRLKSK